MRGDIGLPDSELGIGADSIIDPRGDGPRIWFHVMPDAKVVKNRLHLDIHVSGSRSDPLATRMQRVDAEARRLTDLGTTFTGALSADGLDHYAAGMKDPEGNEFESTDAFARRGSSCRSCYCSAIHLSGFASGANPALA